MRPVLTMIARRHWANSDNRRWAIVALQSPGMVGWASYVSPISAQRCQTRGAAQSIDASRAVRWYQRIWTKGELGASIEGNRRKLSGFLRREQASLPSVSRSKELWKIHDPGRPGAPPTFSRPELHRYLLCSWSL